MRKGDGPIADTPTMSEDTTESGRPWVDSTLQTTERATQRLRCLGELQAFQRLYKALKPMQRRFFGVSP